MRRSRDRRGGGGVQTPPPQQVVENPEAQQGAGYISRTCTNPFDTHSRHIRYIFRYTFTHMHEPTIMTAATEGERVEEFVRCCDYVARSERIRGEICACRIAGQLRDPGQVRRMV